MTTLRTILLLLVLCGQVEAGTYWVSPTGAAAWGSAQSATPLSGTACASLTTANANLVAGDVVYLRGGTYSTHIFPANSGATNNPISYLAYTGETPVISNGSTTYYGIYYHGIALIARNWIKVRGLRVERNDGPADNTSRLLMITHGGSFNEIDDCVFDGRSEASNVNIWDGGSTPHPTGDPCVHNWIHGCTLASLGNLYYDGAVNDAGGVQIGVPGYDSDSGNNTFEDCIFYGGGHHNIETFTKRNVIKDCIFHNEGNMPNNTGYTPLYGPDSNGLWGNRNIQIYDGYASDGVYNLVEGNKFLSSGTSADDDGGDGMTITAPKNIIRFNAVANSANNGVLFKMGGASESHTNRFYNNTIIRSGRWDDMGVQWQGLNFRWYGSYTNFGTIIKNNIMYGFGGSSEVGGGPANPNAYGTYFINNWFSTNGNPMFVSTNWTMADAFDFTKPDMRLTTNSAAIDAGAALTQTVGSGSGSTSLTVSDALYFQDGTWGSVLAGHQADWIAIGTVTNVAQISSVNHTNNTITLAAARSWVNNDPVWLYKDSGGEVVLLGTAPDLGAYEFTGETPLDTTPPTISAILTGPSSTSCTVIWSTDESATSGLEWGLTASYGNSATNSSLVTSHSLNATSLSQGTTYHFRVHSSDAAGNSAVSADDTFTTTSEGGLPPSEASTDGLNATILNIGTINKL
jgi:hypothetical protein